MCRRDAVVALGRGCARHGSGTYPPRVIGRGGFALAGQFVAVMRHSRAIVPARRTPVRLPPSPRRPGVAPTLHRPAVTLTLRRRGVPQAPRPPPPPFRGLLSPPRVLAEPSPRGLA